MANGGYFHLLHPHHSDPFDVEVIAHALSIVNRFGGHTRQPYSVAQHSVLVSNHVPAQYALQGLLHDAAEAFLGDIPSPLKQLLPDFREIERRVEITVRRRLALPDNQHPSVKEADLRALATEKRDLMPAVDEWTSLAGIEPFPEKIVPHLTTEAAKRAFLERYEQIKKEQT